MMMMLLDGDTGGRDAVGTSSLASLALDVLLAGSTLQGLGLGGTGL